jgi:hypothetical protein
MLAKVTLIDLSENALRGPIPTTITEMIELTSLSLAGNQLTGVIPRTIFQLRRLTWLSLYGNKLTGTIPDSISQLSKLTNLDLANNALAGHVPALPFGQYTGSTAYCCLEGSGTNHFACPLPAGVDTCNGNTGACKTTCK